MATPQTKGLLLPLALIGLLLASASAGNFYDDFEITWGDGRAQIKENGQLLTCTLDKTMGSGFQSKKEYMFGQIDMKIKLVHGNSAGTVTAYYLSSKGEKWDEIDFEFLGNLTGQPYTLHTNVFTQGKGDREMQFHLWFDPTTDFHTYTIRWNLRSIVFFVDGTPMREFKNMESMGIPYPTKQPMRIYSSLWNADDWATQGGRIKTDWSKAPFTASYTGFNDDDSCTKWSWQYEASCPNNKDGWMWKQLNPAQYGQMKWVQEKYIIYNYCTDYKRFPQGLPRECSA